MHIVQPPTDEQLLAQTSMDGEAFGAFYDRHHLALFAALRRRVGSVDVALDLTAEVFAAALERCGSFSDRGPGSAKAWLHAIARHQLIDLYRSGRVEDRARQQLKMDPLVISDRDADSLERLQAQESGVLEALAALPQHEREAVRARVVDEIDYPAIADTLRVSQSVVRKRVSRGLRRLRNTMQEAS